MLRCVERVSRKSRRGAAKGTVTGSVALCVAKRLSVSFLAGITALSPLLAQAQSLPTGGQVEHGTATFSAPSSTSLLIDQASDHAILSFDTFSIGSGNSVHFQNGSGSTLNRVRGGYASQIDGSLTATGNLLLINPNGVIVGRDGAIDTGGSFLASTRDVSNTDFLDGGDLTFSGTSTGAIVNQGSVTSLDGDVVMIAHEVRNEGSIDAPNGTVGLAAGIEVLLSDTSVDNGKILVKAGQSGNGVTNEGAIRAAQVELRAHGGNVYALASNNDDLVEATGVTQKGGRIFLTAEGGQVRVEQKVRARRVVRRTNKPTQTRGGDVYINADFASVSDLIDVDGAFGGSVAIEARSARNYGTISAQGTDGDGGTVNINVAQDYVAPLNSLIDVSGSENGGSITINAGQTFFNSGDMTASGGNGSGGLITLNAPIMRFQSGDIIADGADQGGTIQIGGTKTDTRADTIFADARTAFSASATANGSTGGDITFWSNEDTAFGGTLLTTAAESGGFMEVSGHNLIRYGGTAEGGLLLLDPKNINITAAAANALFNVYTIVDPNNSGSSGSFGDQIVIGAGLLLARDRFDDANGNNSGALYVFDEATRGLVAELTGSNPDDQLGSSGIGILTGTDIAVVRSPFLDNGALNQAGAVTFIDLANRSILGGASNSLSSGAISPLNSLMGNSASDFVGQSADLLRNSDLAYVISSQWDNGAAADAGAVTFIDLTSKSLVGSSPNTPVVGVIDATNSIVGTNTGDNVGAGGVAPISGTDYAYIRSYNWGNGTATRVGAATFIDPQNKSILGGAPNSLSSGIINASNSVVGSSTDDRVGWSVWGFSGTDVAAIQSRYWNAGFASEAGAVTFVDFANKSIVGLPSTGMISGVVSAANSLVGSHTDDDVGRTIGHFPDQGVAYVGTPDFRECFFFCGSNDADVGAITFVDLANKSFFGSAPNTPIAGIVSSSNSLVGSQNYDRVGQRRPELLGDTGVAFLRSNAGLSGAITFIDLENRSLLGATSNTAVAGVVTSANSIVANDSSNLVGNATPRLISGTDIAYLSLFGLDNGVISDIGSATFIDLENKSFLGQTANTLVAGSISSTNSVIGTSANDRVGSIWLFPDKELAALNSSQWDNGGTADVGAITFIDLANKSFVGAPANTPVAGPVSASNSIIGTTAGDQIGANGVRELGTNGLGYIGSRLWSNGATNGAGAVTFIDLNNRSFLGGATDSLASGTINSGNSIIGTTVNDQVGSSGVQSLDDSGLGYIGSPNWDNGAPNVGAVTFIDLDNRSFLGGVAGDLSSGTIGAANSVVGTSANDNVGNSGVRVLSGGAYAAIQSPGWNNGSDADVGAVTFVDLVNQSFLGGTPGEIASNTISTGNSFFGANANDRIGQSFIYTLFESDVAVVQSSSWNNGAAIGAGAITFVDLANNSFLGHATNSGATGKISALNSLVGDKSGDRVGNFGVLTPNNNSFGNRDIIYVRSREWQNGTAQRAGAITLIDLANKSFLGGATNTPVAGVLGPTNSILGSSTNDDIGSQSVWYLVDQQVGYLTADRWDNGPSAFDAGAVVLIDFENKSFLGAPANTLVAGEISAANALVGTSSLDFVGRYGVGVFGDSNIAFVRNPFWDNGITALDAGAVGLIDLEAKSFLNSPPSGIVAGALDASNSQIGTETSQQLGLRTLPFDDSDYFYIYGRHTDVRQIDTNAFDPSAFTFGASPADDVDISPDVIARTLKSGTDVTLQANNDITVIDAVEVTQNGVTPGNFTLQAGRSISILNDIDTSGGDLTLIANETLANGVIDAYRDPGSAGLFLNTGVSLSSGLGVLTLDLRDGAGKTNSDLGFLSFGGSNELSASMINLHSSADIVQNGAITFDGPLALVTPNNGVRLGNTGNDFQGPVSGEMSYASLADQNGIDIGDIDVAGRFDVQAGGDITIKANSSLFGGWFDFRNQTAGSDNSFTLEAGSQFSQLDDDTLIVTDTFTNLAGSSALSASGNSRFLIYSDDDTADTRGGLSGRNFYNISFGDTLSNIVTNSTDNWFLTQRQPTLKITGTDTNVTYDGTPQSLSGYAVSQLVNGDTINQALTTGPTLGSFTNAGTYTSGLLSGGASAIGYAIELVQGTLEIAKKSLSIAGAGTVTKVYDGNTDATVNNGNFDITGLVGLESLSVTKTAGTYNDPNVDTADNVTVDLSAGDFSAGAGTLLSNYALPIGSVIIGSGGAGTASITPKGLTVAGAGTVSKVYDGNTDATVGTSNFDITGLIGSETLSVTETAGTYNSPNVVDADQVNVTLAADDFSGSNGFMANNYALPIGTVIIGSGGSGTAEITPKALSIQGAGTVTKVFDGNTDAAVVPGNFLITGLIGSETIAVTETFGTYNSPNVTDADSVDVVLAGDDFSADAGTLLSNYSLPIGAVTIGAGGSGTASITERGLEVTADAGQFKIQGDIDPPFLFTLTNGNLIGSDAFTGVLERDPGEDPGLYPLLVGSLTAGPNYLVSFVSNLFEIRLRPSSDIFQDPQDFFQPPEGGNVNDPEDITDCLIAGSSEEECAQLLSMLTPAN